MTLSTLEKVLIANKYDITIDTGCGYVSIHMDYLDKSIEKLSEALSLMREWGKAKVRCVDTYHGVIQVSAEMK